VIVALSWTLTLGLVTFALRSHRRLVRVAEACHELRGPLCAVQLGLSGLAGEPARLAAIELELQRAGRALDDLSAARSGARGPTCRRPVDLCELVEAYAPTWTALAAGHGATLQLEPPRGPAVVVADPLRVAQACANLVANAAEHGGGVVRVRVRPAAGHVRVEVADDGPGLPHSVAALTATAGTRRGRRGHGLAIAAAIAGHHGGRLSAAPSESGARVILELPVASSQSVLRGRFVTPEREEARA